MPLSLSNKKKLRNMLFIVFIIAILLSIRIGYIQFIWGPELSSMASSQQSQSRKITAKRGTIYDSTGEYILATSSSVETVNVNPTLIPSDQKEKISNDLARIFELDYETVLERVSKRSSIETIIQKVDKEKTDELRKWMSENNITTGINIDEDSKRYYPYNDLAAQVIGFCGSDNQGLDGVESKYDNELKGTNGKIQSRIHCRKTD